MTISFVPQVSTHRAPSSRVGRSLRSAVADQLVLGTAVVESRAKYIRQIGGGPAMGIYQMEPGTHNDIWTNVLAYKTTLRNLMLSISINRNPEEMLGNLFYATAMCRVHYYRFSEALPLIHDYEGLAQYHKTYYNTSEGATEITESTEIFKKITEGGYV